MLYFGPGGGGQCHCHEPLPEVWLLGGRENERRSMEHMVSSFQKFPRSPSVGENEEEPESNSPSFTRCELWEKDGENFLAGVSRLCGQQPGTHLGWVGTGAGFFFSNCEHQRSHCASDDKNLKVVRLVSKCRASIR